MTFIKGGRMVPDQMQGLARTSHLEISIYTALCHRRPVLLRSGQKASAHAGCL